MLKKFLNPKFFLTIILIITVPFLIFNMIMLIDNPSYLSESDNFGLVLSFSLLNISLVSIYIYLKEKNRIRAQSGYLDNLQQKLERVEKIKEEKQEEPSYLEASLDYARTELTRFIEIQRQQTQNVYRLVFWMSFSGFALLLSGSIKALFFTSETQGFPSVEALLIFSGVIIEFISAIALSIFKTTQENFIKNLKILERQNLIGIIFQIIEDEKSNQDLNSGKYKLETAQILAKNLTHANDD